MISILCQHLKHWILWECELISWNADEVKRKSSTMTLSGKSGNRQQRQGSFIQQWGQLRNHLHHDNHHLHSPTTSTLTLSWPSTLWMKINIEFSKICYGFPKVYLVNTFIYICICVIIINIGNCNQFWYCPTLLLTRQKYSPASPVLTEVRFKSNLKYVHNILILITE